MSARGAHVNTVNSDWLAHMNSRLRLVPPKTTFAQVSGNRIIPMGSPLGATI